MIDRINHTRFLDFYDEVLIDGVTNIGDYIVWNSIPLVGSLLILRVPSRKKNTTLDFLYEK